MMDYNIKRIITRRFPIVTWLPGYNFNKFIFDFIAGVTVALMLMPTSIANAAIAGMEPEYGLYAAFAGGIVYSIFGTNKNINIGSESVICVMVYEQIRNRNVDYAILLCFLTGVVQLLMVAFRLDILMDFFSVPLISGYISSCSIVIMTSQLKNLLGLKVSSSGFMDDITKVIDNAKDIKYIDLALGVVCIVVLILLRKLPDFKTDDAGDEQNSTQNNWNRVFTLISNSRNILVIMTCFIVAYLYERFGDGSPFTLTGTVKEGIPPFQLPPFTTVDQKNNSVPFTEMVSNLGASIIMVPIVSAVTNIAVLKVFATNGKMDASQELLSIGMIHIVGSFFSSMPVTAAFSRSSVNESSGVKTQAGGIITSILVLLTLQFLTPYLFYIPKTSLAALIVSAMFFMIEYEVVEPIWRSNKKDFVTLVVTFVGCLFLKIEYGITLGVLTNTVFLLWSSVRPTVTIDTKQSKSGSQYIMITPKSSLYFPSVDYVNSKIGKALSSSKVMPVVINCQYMMNIDFTAATGISYLMEECFLRKQPLYFINTEDSVDFVLKNILNEGYNNFKSIEECEAKLQGEQLLETKVYRRKLSTFVLRKFSVPLASVEYNGNRSNLNRRHSTIHHY